MSLQIPVAFVTQYTGNILMLSQQKIAKLRATCRFETMTGKRMMIERMGPKNPQKRTTRHAPTPISDAKHDRRVLTIVDWEVPADLIDDQDKLRLLIDPQSYYTQNQLFGLRRAQDDEVIEALGRTILTGEDGATSVTNYASDECRLIDGSGALATAGSGHTDTVATPLTIEKLLLCKQLMDDAEIDEERQRYFTTNPFNINQFINQTEVKSSEYNHSKALAEGKMDIVFAGFRFIPSTRLITDTTETDCVKSYAFAEGSVTFSAPQDPKVSVSIRHDLSDSVQVYCTQTCGASRNEGPAVVEINLKKSA
jgi:hypothetical protein